VQVSWYCLLYQSRGFSDRCFEIQVLTSAPLHHALKFTILYRYLSSGVVGIVGQGSVEGQGRARRAGEGAQRESEVRGVRGP
jgi:hypothetical protein